MTKCFFSRGSLSCWWLRAIPRCIPGHPRLRGAVRRDAPRFAGLMTGLQIAGSLLALPVGLASGYSIYHANFSAEAQCQSLRGNIVSTLDKSADASTLRMLVRRDVAAFEASCGDVDPDAVAAFRTLFAARTQPATMRKAAGASAGSARGAGDESCGATARRQGEAGLLRRPCLPSVPRQHPTPRGLRRFATRWSIVTRKCLCPRRPGGGEPAPSWSWSTGSRAGRKSEDSCGAGRYDSGRALIRRRSRSASRCRSSRAAGPNCRTVAARDRGGKSCRASWRQEWKLVRAHPAHRAGIRRFTASRIEGSARG